MDSEGPEFLLGKSGIGYNHTPRVAKQSATRSKVESDLASLKATQTLRYKSACLKDEGMLSSKVQIAKRGPQTIISPSSGEQQQLLIGFVGLRGRRVAFWTIVVLFGFLQAWSQRLLVDHDGVAYLDIAENYARGAWSIAINGFYSPLYSWLMAIAIRLLRFPISWESTVLHLVNFAGYLTAYACFEFLLVQVMNKEAKLYPDAAGLSESAWQMLGLALFLYSSLFMANLSGHSGQGDPGSTPDIFVLCFAFLAAGLLMRMQSDQARIGTYSLFGVALGFGYLAKTAMFPLSFVFMAVAAVISLRQRKKAAAFLLAPLFFGIVAGPWIMVLSNARGKFAYGDAGTLTYRWLVGPHANPPEWAGQTQEGESFVHPPRRLSIDPPVYEFGTPIAGTFPLWYGNSYWLEGWKFRFSGTGQLRVLHESYNVYRSILEHQKEYLVLLLFLIIVQGTVRGYFKTLLRCWALWLPAIAALGMYALVRVEPRYVSAFVALLWISLFAAVKLPEKVQEFALWAVVATVLTTGVGVLHGGMVDLHSILRRAPSEQAEVAEGLHKLGFARGQSLATIGIPRDSFYWARLAGVRVISEIPTLNVNQYWFGPPATQERVRSLFVQAGAVALVTDAMPEGISLQESGLSGWGRIGQTSYFLLPLRNRASTNRAQVDSKAFKAK